jgi:hypothetical protein
VTNNIPQPTPEVARLLLGLAQSHAPILLRPGQETLEVPVPVFARQLANEGLLVLLVDKTMHEVGKLPQLAAAYAEGYKQLYMLLTNVLFPSLSQIKAFHYSYSMPTLMIVLQGEADPVMEVLAGYISPYIVVRQDYDNIFSLEMHSLMQRILDRLEARRLDPAIREQVCKQGATILHNILTQPLNQLPLIGFDPEIAGMIQSKPHTGTLVEPVPPVSDVAQGPAEAPPSIPPQAPRRYPPLKRPSRHFPSVVPRRPSPPDKD